MAVRVTPQSGSDKWKNRLSGATQEITDGVNRVTEAPGAKAASKKAKWYAAITQAQDKWARNVAAVSLDQWKKAFLSIGVQRIAQGAQAKQDKYTRFAQEFYPFLDQNIQKVNAMPDTTIEERFQKALMMMRLNHDFKRNG
ncbi:MAG: hypothetical protein ACREQ5_01620 [Candidatus Dormibacteria bacterium]